MANTISYQGRKTKRDHLILFDRVLFSIVIVTLSFVVISDIDVNWDNLAYHLPFAARRAGIIPKNAYRFGAWLEECYNAFPRLPYYINGTFWRLTGSPNGGSLVSLLGFSAFCLFVNRLFRVPLLLAFVTFAAIPVVQVNITHAAVDLPANLAFTCALVLATLVLVERRSAWWALGALAMAALAGNYKPQFVPLVAIFVPAFLTATVLVQGRDELLTSIGTRKITFWASFAIAVFGCYFVALHNFIFFGNPLYPIRLSIFGWALPGVQINDLYSEPLYLRDAPQQVRWFLSVIEYHAFDLRPVPYSLGQGDVPATAYSSRMGGYLSIFALFNAWLFLTTTWRKSGGHRLLAVAFCLGTIGVASLPASHELRYFSFWILYLVSMNLAYIWTRNTPDNIEKRYFSAISICAFTFTTAVTGGIYFLPSGNSLDKLINNFQIKERFVSKFEDGKNYCLLNWGQMGMLAASHFYPGRSYEIVYGRTPDSCPPNSFPSDFSATK